MTEHAINNGLSISEKAYGTMKDGSQISQFTLKNSSGIKVEIINFGAVITSIDTPDKEGHFQNIVLGFPNLSGYEDDTGRACFGAIVGRYANRIAGGKFELDGKTYQIPLNNGPNALHGGPIGFDRKVWQAEKLPISQNQVGVRLSLQSPDGEQGFPGNLSVQVTYVLNNNNELILHYQATTDKSTVINLTNHSYFNLGGEGSGSVENHILQVFADYYTPSDANSIPVGEITPVDNTPMDFRRPIAVGSRMRDSFEQLVMARGYDHNWVIKKQFEDKLQPAMHLYDPKSQRTLEILTTQPGMQIYTANYLVGNYLGTSGKMYRQTDGIAFETQHFPDAPNKPNFPSTRLDPGQTLDETTVFRFGVGKN